MTLRQLLFPFLCVLAAPAAAQDIPAAAPNCAVRRVVDGNDWQHECPSVQALRERLILTPEQNAGWTFF